MGDAGPPEKDPIACCQFLKFSYHYSSPKALAGSSRSLLDRPQLNSAFTPTSVQKADGFEPRVLRVPEQTAEVIAISGSGPSNGAPGHAAP